MSTINQALAWKLLEERLASTTNERHRQNLETAISHSKAEAAPGSPCSADPGTHELRGADGAQVTAGQPGAGSDADKPGRLHPPLRRGAGRPPARGTRRSPPGREPGAVVSELSGRPEQALRPVVPLSTTDRTSRPASDLPEWPRGDRRAQWRRTKSRRQRKIVAGVTISRIRPSRPKGSVPASRASHARSGHISPATSPGPFAQGDSEPMTQHQDLSVGQPQGLIGLDQPRSAPPRTLRTVRSAGSGFVGPASSPCGAG
jgi:hypothetical protein